MVVDRTSVPPVANDGAMDRLALKQLGHALGLEEDHLVGSVMSPDSGSIRVEDLMVSDRHLDQLLAWYG